MRGRGGENFCSHADRRHTLFDRPTRGEQAILLHVRLGAPPYREDDEEFRSLAIAAGAEVSGELPARLRTANPRYLIGVGKLEELKELAEVTCADLILVDHPLSPAQQRNLEKALDLRVVDRTGLILDIFALRARTFEGKLQVELAQLEHLSTRLVRGWTHLERQKGGIGLRGPGETQLESDRRLLGKRITQLKMRLERLERSRGLARQQRRKQEIPTISLVGYTNAGKSTLFNRLTDENVKVADQVFATLDPTLRRLELPVGGPVILADTVGFVRDLPHELVAAFHSTLEETTQARLLLHVIDCSDPAHQERIEDVDEVLRQIGADRLPVIQVYNKADILGAPTRVDRAETGMPRRVWLSAVTGEGIDILIGAITDFLHLDVVCGTASLTVGQARLRARLYELGSVKAERDQPDGGWELDLEMDRRSYRELQRQENLEISGDHGADGADGQSAILH
ncbi:MAG: ribosome rescue GTPase HflX [Gammaproteobacteria bacterium]